jgi:3'(2'), 5'-bisphosphate nucleotidase
VSAADAELLREPAVALARQAGAAILAIYRSGFSVAHKDDRSPLTEADLAAHRILVDGLQALTPELPVLSEESAHVPYAQRHRWHRYWLVDPLDGTREFVKRNGEFTVNVALIDDGRPVLGVVYAPDRDELAVATSAGGATLVRDGTGRRLRVGARHPGPWRVAGSRSHKDPRMDRFLAALGAHELVAVGSSLKFVLVAEGAADVYLRFGPTSEWDTAAGQCVLEAAGGRVTDLAGAPLRYNTKESLLNPDFIAVGDGTVDWLALGTLAPP